MSPFDEGDLDHNGRPIVAPLTPPQEPEPHGLAIDGVLSQLEKIVDQQDCSSEQKEELSKILADSSLGETSSSRSYSSNNNGINMVPGASPISAKEIPRQTVHRYISNNETELKAQRTSSEQGIPLKDRRLSKKYSSQDIGDVAQSHEESSVAVLSPIFSGQSGNTDGALSMSRPLLPVEEGQILQAESPSVGEASYRVGQDRSLEVSKRPRNLTIDVGSEKSAVESPASGRPRVPRALSTPASMKSPNTSVYQDQRKSRTASRSDQSKPHPFSRTRQPSPLPASIPVPPLSLSTYLQLELSSQRPSQVYIHRSASNDFPYESSRVKIERLLNFLLLPHQLEGVLWFGALACLDVWLYTFTILPLRMIKSIYILFQSWMKNVVNEVHFIIGYIVTGSRRMYQRRRTRGQSSASVASRSMAEPQMLQDLGIRSKNRSKHHRRMKSVPSLLQPDDKADILKGFLIIVTCAILLRLDASRMYHWVRGQAAIKLYVIYNLLEVCDRLLSAIGQDVLECLFSQEALERLPDGHSKIWRPAWLFLLALAYCVLHATALFYQVVTLNVAVNSYSNALITLLMSNQFVEIKGTVFKKFEKESLFQVTCADIVERFQLWHMLIIIASRNIVETGGFSMGVPSLLTPAAPTTTSTSPNITQAAPPLSAASILPASFMIVPSMLKSLNSYVPAVSHVLGPFVIVLGSEMVIDWLKHAYINKFNNTKPVIYGRFLDILAKDYYTNAFGEQNLTKRFGLPVIPLSCLMIRAGFQTYQMFVASWVPAPSSSNAATLTSIHQHYSTTRATPTSTAGIIVRKMDEFFSQLPSAISDSRATTYFTTTLVVLLMFLFLLVCKLVLGMGLLAFSRARYESMKQREHSGNPSYYVDGGRRLGGWGVVEVDEDKRRVIYEDDPAGLQALRAREAKDKAKKEQEKDRGFGAEGLEKVKRYEMVAKRIW